MNKNLTNKNKTSYKMLVFWSIIAVLTISFISFVIIKFIDSKVVTSLDLINLRDEQIFNREEGTYYVYVYSQVGVTEGKLELDRAAEIEDEISTYLTYARRNPSALRMYGMVVDSGSGTYGNYSCLIDGAGVNTDVVNRTKFSELRIHKEDLPIILKITNGKVQAAYLSELDIRKELQTARGIQ